MRLPILTVLMAAPLLPQLPPPNSAGVAMGHLHFLTRDAEAHKKIWVEGLGAKVVKAGTLELYMLPDVLIALRKGEPSGGTEGTVVNHLGFKVKDLDATKARLTAAGAKLDHDVPQGRQSFFLFPEGVMVEFIEDKSLPVAVQHHHIHFASNQLDEMRAWYATVFGAVPGMRGKFKAADLPGVNLSWNQVGSPPAPTKGRTMDHIGFEVRNLEAYCKKLEAAGVKFDRGYTKLPALGLEVAFFTDPWGTNIELTEGLAALR
jgi:catechol 2,3-dioxygenase-like lactoylglutathione lyase family enzyme